MRKQILAVLAAFVMMIAADGSAVQPNDLDQALQSGARSGSQVKKQRAKTKRKKPVQTARSKKHAKPGLNRQRLSHEDAIR